MSANAWIVKGHKRRNIDYGEVRNQADENLWWVFWYVSCKAEKVNLGSGTEVETFDSQTAAFNEFERRANQLWNHL